MFVRLPVFFKAGRSRVSPMPGLLAAYTLGLPRLDEPRPLFLGTDIDIFLRLFLYFCLCLSKYTSLAFSKFLSTTLFTPSLPRDTSVNSAICRFRFS